MFTGIIETLGEVLELNKQNSNLELTIKSSITNELKIDQSVSHNGVCLTVTDIKNDTYKVTAINETLQISNIGNLQIKDKINLERAAKYNARLDGHMVQGHVDTTAKCTKISDENGSFIFSFELEKDTNLIIEKGSICVNGVSLTVVKPAKNTFSVAIIPYTFENTNFHKIRQNDLVNIEFDIIGKYLANFAKAYK